MPDYEGKNSQESTKFDEQCLGTSNSKMSLPKKEDSFLQKSNSQDYLPKVIKSKNSENFLCKKADFEGKKRKDSLPPKANVKDSFHIKSSLKYNFNTVAKSEDFPHKKSERVKNSIPNNADKMNPNLEDKNVKELANNTEDFKLIRDENLKTYSKNVQYSCEHCRSLFGKKVDLVDHLITCFPVAQKSTEPSSNRSRRKRQYSYPCMHCDFEAKRRKILDLHIIESHPELSQNSQKKIVDKSAIDEAKMEVDGKVYYHCKECGKNLFSPYTFSWHRRIHTGERPFTCHLCGKQFRVNQGLARHLRETHAGIKKFPCDLCGRMFTTKRNVDDHRRIHTGERPYVCNVCGKSFKQKASLFVHNRIHSDLFPFKCSYCQQGFRAKSHLMVHITIHTGEKPHSCDICSRQFRIKFELKRHRLVHFDEKPWKCSECEQTFRQKRYLVKHRKSNHPTIADPVEGGN